MICGGMPISRGGLLMASTAWPSATPGAQVERQRHGRELALVGDRQRPDAVGVDVDAASTAAPRRRSSGDFT